MAKHRVNWHLDMGKDQHREGAIIDLDEKLSAQLVPLGVVTPLEEEAPVAQETIEPEKLAKLTKAQLVDYAKAKFGKELDPSSASKDQLLAEIAALAAVEVSE
jgi:hypothetical protein